ncbi:GntR family transcriptional regulator [Hoeflea prorocentri]|uniref:GntR family transcriptional regulator n=1 Tax=Hoeflea prorocentri TaxID=1922333 RepID=A0A9X3UI95_9HYPH|nr:GntR family transcriptional regulator [Hoeflea prorocentri]MCY6381827.1 GntR family transcriptional regulator [Hoeflea prorocentri]MDA5399627.1 GntR family transcriptional regulator [Hoeflea prorocentri]
MSKVQKMRHPTKGSGLPLAKHAYQDLLHRIISFELEPYQSLSEASVSEMLGISRTPAREALALLAERGFVEVMPQRGSRVSPLRNSDLERSQFMREALELALLRRVVALPARDKLIESLRKEITLQRTYLQFDDKDGFYGSDEEFHGLIAAYAGRSDVLPDIRRMKVHMDRFRHLMVQAVEDLDVVIHQHTQIADAIETGDADAAEAAMLTHLRRIFSYVDEARSKYPDYFDSSPEPNLRVRP